MGVKVGKSYETGFKNDGILLSFYVLFL